MLDPIVALVTAINEAIKTQLFLPMMIFALSIVGLIWIFGNHENAKTKATWLAIGASVILGANAIVTKLQGVIH